MGINTISRHSHTNHREVQQHDCCAWSACNVNRADASRLGLVALTRAFEMDFHTTTPLYSCYISSGRTIQHPAYVLLAIVLYFLSGFTWIHCMYSLEWLFLKPTGRLDVNNVQ